MKNVYSIRRGILKALKECALGGEATAMPMSVDELIGKITIPELMYVAPENIVDEWQQLRDLGYIEPIPGYGGVYCKIGMKGLAQLTIGVPQDYFIHGPSAIK